ncbi:MAG: amidohydrolase family protein [Deltaproteobacteria bacterium]
MTAQCILARTLYTGRSVKNDVYLTFSGTTIKSIRAKPAAEVVGEFPVVTPAFIDPHSHIGLVRAGEPASEEEANEKMESIIALADSLDSLQMDDQAFADAIENGVLYSCILPGSGNIIGGRSAVIRHYALDSSEALIGRAGVKAAFGYNPMSTTSWKGTRPNTRMGAVSLFRKKLDEVATKLAADKKVKAKKEEAKTLSLEEKLLAEILAGKVRLRCHVHKIDDIATILRLTEEFPIKVSIEHAMDVHQPGIYEKLGKKGITVVFGPLDAFAYKVELKQLKHEAWRNVQHLIASEIPFGLMTDHPVVLSRNLFLQTRLLVRAGLTKQRAIEVITRQNAEILGISEVLGVLERGKWASFVCFNGDPFDLTSYPSAVYGEGQLIYKDH